MCPHLEGRIAHVQKLMQHSKMSMVSTANLAQRLSLRCALRPASQRHGHRWGRRLKETKEDRSCPQVIRLNTRAIVDAEGFSLQVISRAAHSRFFINMIVARTSGLRSSQYVPMAVPYCEGVWYLIIDSAQHDKNSVAR